MEQIKTSNVSRLPNLPVREWRYFEDGVSRFMRTNGASEDAIQHVCARLRTAFMNATAADRLVVLAKTGDEAAQGINVIFSHVTAGLLGEMAAIALENYHLGGGE